MIAAASLWGGIGVFFNLLSSVGFSQMQVVAIRVTTAAAALTAYILCKDPSLMKIRLRDCWCFIGTGIVSLTFFNWCYFTAIKITSLAVAAVLMYTSPVFVMLFSAVLFHERIRKQDLAALALTLAGCMCVAGLFTSSGAGKASVPGIVLGLCSGVGYALYSIFGRFALEKGYRSVTISEYTFLFAAAASLPLSGLHTQLALFSNPNSWIGAVCIGVLCCVFPFILYTKGLSGISTGKAAILATVEPAVAAILSCILYHENLWGTKLVGILLIFSAVIVLNAGKETD